MKRRDFALRALALPALLSSSNLAKATPEIKRPAPLRAGAKVGLITPGSYLNDEGLQRAVENIESLGMEVVLAPNIRAKYGYVAGTDQQRLDDLHQMFADTSIDAVWCARGGYGCTRLLPKIDYRLIKRNAKPLIGYSDITALLNAFYERLGLVGYHGPVGASEFTDYTRVQLESVLLNDWSGHTIPLADANIAEEDALYQYQVIRAGRAEGKLVGGNLSLLAAVTGTRYEPDYRNKLVFIEDVGEKPYSVDRMLVQLRQSKTFHRAAGIVMGIFAGCAATPDSDSLSLFDTVKGQTEDLGIPVVYGFSFGHIDNQCTFPVGATATLDTAQRTVRLS